MPGAVEPGRHDLGELLGAHAGVRGHDELDDSLLSRGGQRLEVARQHGGERRLGLPLGVLRRERLHAVERERELHVHGVFDPERAVVVEHGDPLRLGHEARGALAGGGRDEIEDGLLRHALVPGRERRRLRAREDREEETRCQGDSSRVPDCAHPCPSPNSMRAALYHARARIEQFEALRWARTGSNRRPPRCKRGALPAELRARAGSRRETS